MILPPSARLWAHGERRWDGCTSGGGVADPAAGAGRRVGLRHARKVRLRSERRLPSSRDGSRHEGRLRGWFSPGTGSARAGSRADPRVARDRADDGGRALQLVGRRPICTVARSLTRQAIVRARCWRSTTWRPAAGRRRRREGSRGDAWSLGLGSRVLEPGRVRMSHSGRYASGKFRLLRRRQFDARSALALSRWRSPSSAPCTGSPKTSDGACDRQVVVILLLSSAASGRPAPAQPRHGRTNIISGLGQAIAASCFSLSAHRLELAALAAIDGASTASSFPPAPGLSGRQCRRRCWSKATPALGSASTRPRYRAAMGGNVVATTDPGVAIAADAVS